MNRHLCKVGTLEGVLRGGGEFNMEVLEPRRALRRDHVYRRVPNKIRSCSACAGGSLCRSLLNTTTSGLTSSSLAALRRARFAPYISTRSCRRRRSLTRTTWVMMEEVSLTAEISSGRRPRYTLAIIASLCISDDILLCRQSKQTRQIKPVQDGSSAHCRR